MSQETKTCKHCQSEIPKKAKVCPQCRKKQGGKLKWIVIAVVVVLIIAAASGGGDNESNQEAGTKTENQASGKKKKAKEEVKEEVSYTPYSVSQMMDDLDNNALNAETTYKDKYVEITGVLSNIDSSGKYISLRPEDDEYAIIDFQCFIKSDEQKSQVAAMSKGQSVTLRGKVTSVGEVLGYSLDIDEIL